MSSQPLCKKSLVKKLSHHRMYAIFAPFFHFKSPLDFQDGGTYTAVLYIMANNELKFEIKEAYI